MNEPPKGHTLADAGYVDLARIDFADFAVLPAGFTEAARPSAAGTAEGRASKQPSHDQQIVFAPISRKQAIATLKAGVHDART